MNQKEILMVSIGIFFTIIAWMIIDVYHIQTQQSLQSDIKPVSVPQYKIDSTVFDTLKQKIQ
jgi:hypothetical protein